MLLRMFALGLMGSALLFVALVLQPLVRKLDTEFIDNLVDENYTC